MGRAADHAEEIDYLLALANTYLARALTAADIVWSFSGVRPLYDDGASDPSSVTRDYVLRIDNGAEGANGPAGAPVLSIFGGKLTTYRKLAEHAMTELKPYFPRMGPEWTVDGGAAWALSTGGSSGSASRAPPGDACRAAAPSPIGTACCDGRLPRTPADLGRISGDSPPRKSTIRSA
jgi:hypothetical protein